MALLLGLAFAQFDPTKQWSTLTTEHFDIIYHQGLERVASEAAIYAENAYATLSKEFEEPRGRIPLVLSDAGEFLNGFSNPVDHTVGIYTGQFRSSDIFNPRLGSWWETVIFHELVHSFDLSQRRGDNRSSIFGDTPSPNGVKPVPFIEGTAVYMKYKFLGESRLNDAQTLMVLRQMVLSGKYPSLDEIRQYYSKTTWPSVGWLVYNYGAWLVKYLEVRFGPDAYKRFTDANAAGGSIKDFNWPFQEAFGVSLDQIYADFVQWLPSQFEPEIARIKAAGLTPATQLTHLGFYADSPTDSPNGLLYAHSSPLRTGLRLLSVNGEREFINGPAQYPQWAPDGNSLIFVANYPGNPYQDFSDLYYYERLSGQSKRLTSGERIYYARFAADGKSVFVAQNTPDGSTQLGRYFIDLKSLQPLRSFPNQDGVIHSFTASPDGKSIVLSLLRRGGFQDLYSYQLDNGKLTPLTQDKNVDSDPVFSPDGKYVIYSSDVGRVYNLYAYRLEDGAIFQVTNLLGGAFAPTISNSKQFIVYSGYDESGYNLYQVAYKPESWKRVQIPKETLPEYKPAEAAKGTPYDPLRYLRPMYWLPSAGVYTTSTGIGVGGYAGVSFSGADPIGIHSYSVAFGVDSAARSIFYDGSYSFAGLGTPVYVNLSGAGSENAQSIGVDFWAVNGGSSLQYSRVQALVPEVSTTQNTTTHAFTASVVGGTISGNDLSRTRIGLSLVGSAFYRNSWNFSVAGALGIQQRLPLEASHLISLKLGGGYTNSPLVADSFDLGQGTVGWVYGNRPVLAVRGYAYGELRGPQAVVGSLEYRLPPWNLERGLGNWPLFLDDLYLTAFVDAGAASASLSLDQLRFGVGAELRSTLTLMYLAQGASAAVGIAQGIGAPGPRIYINLVIPSLP